MTLAQTTLKADQTLKIEVKGLKHYRSMSEETACYEGTVYVNGKKAFHVANRGHGGCDEQHPIKPFTYADLQIVNDFLKRTHEVETFTCGERTVEIPMDLERFCAKALDQQLDDKDFAAIKRKLQKKVFFAVDGTIREIGYKGAKSMTPAQFEVLSNTVKQKYPKAIILNKLDDATIRGYFFK